MNTHQKDVYSLFYNIAVDLVEAYKSKRKKSVLESWNQLKGAARMYGLQDKEPDYNRGIPFKALHDACKSRSTYVNDVYDYIG